MITIVPANLQFGRLVSRFSTRRIIIHHSASPDVSVKEIHSWHLERGWSGVGYHFVIRADGTIESGRPQDKIGAHAGTEANGDSIGICLTGNFMEYQPRGDQLDALLKLLAYLEDCYGSDLKVLRHKDVAVTDCPGKLFPWPPGIWMQPSSGNDQDSRLVAPALPPWKEAIVSQAIAQNLITEAHNPDDPAPCWFVLAVGLNIMKEAVKIGSK